MSNTTLKNITVAITVMAAAVVVALLAISEPALGEDGENAKSATAPVIGAAATPGAMAASGTPGSTPPDGMPADGMPGSMPANGMPAETMPASMPSDDDAATADPFAEPKSKSDLATDASAFDADTVKTDFQCAPPALSPAALLEELRRSRALQVRERERVEKTRDEIKELRVKLAMQSEAVEKRLAVLVAEKRAAATRIAMEKKAAEEAAQEAKTGKKPRKKKLSPEEIAQQKAARLIEVQRLAAATKGMAPSEAARFLDALDVALAADVVAQMKPKLAGAALARMKPETSAKIATRVVERRNGDK